MTPEQRAAMEQALEALESCTPGDYTTGHVVHPSFDLAAVHKAHTALTAALANDALDKMAENERELGLDYEPVLDNLPSNKDVEDALRAKRAHQLTAAFKEDV